MNSCCRGHPGRGDPGHGAPVGSGGRTRATGRTRTCPASHRDRPGGLDLRSRIVTPHRIYILPTRTWTVLVAIMAAMWYAAISQSNSAAYLLMFFTGSLVMVSAIHAHYALVGLEMRIDASPRFSPAKRHVCPWKCSIPRGGPGSRWPSRQTDTFSRNPPISRSTTSRQVNRTRWNWKYRPKAGGGCR